MFSFFSLTPLNIVLVKYYNYIDYLFMDQASISIIIIPETREWDKHSELSRFEWDH